MGKVKCHAEDQKNLLQEDDAIFVEQFYLGQKSKRPIFLLLNDPDKFHEVIQKKGASLLFYEIGVISRIDSSNDARSILGNISLEEWTWYLQKNKITSIESLKLKPLFFNYLETKRVNISSRLFNQRVRKLSTLSTESLYRIGERESFSVREDINRLLRMRGEKKLKKIPINRDSRFKKDKEIFFNEGYSLKVEDIYRYIISKNIKSLNDLYKKNLFVNSILQSPYYKNARKIQLYTMLLTSNFWDARSFRKNNKYIADIPIEMKHQSKQLKTLKTLEKVRTVGYEPTITTKTTGYKTG